MSFNASDYKIKDWVFSDKNGRLTKVVRTFNSENLVATEYKSSPNSKVGDPSLYITYVYDARGNILAENKEVREWTATQETTYNSASETDIDSSADEVTATISGVETDSSTSSLKVKQQGNITIDSSTPVTTSVSGNISIDDSTPIDISVTGTPSVSVSGTPTVSVSGTPSVNSTIQNTTLDIKLKDSGGSNTAAIDGDGKLKVIVPDAVATNATIQGTPNVAVTGSVGIDDSTPIDTAITNTVATNATIQNTTLDIKLKDSGGSNTAAIDSDGKLKVIVPDSVATNATIQGTPNVAVTGNVSIDDSTPIDTAVTGTVTTNATIQNTTLDIKLKDSGGSNTAAIDSDGKLKVIVPDAVAVNSTIQGTPAVNSTIQNSTLAVTKSGTWDVDSITGTVTTNATIQNSTLATKGKTSYSDTTSDPDYWLGLYNDNLLIKKAVEISASEIITSATFQSTAVDTANGALQITEFLDGSGNVTGRNSQVITWTQALQDLALPGITDIIISASSVANGASENDLIGNLTATGAVGTITWEIVTNASSLANVRIDDQKLEVGSGGLTSSPGDYVLNIKATDSIGKVRAENFTITVGSSYSSTKSLNLTSSSYSGLQKGVYLNSSLSSATNLTGPNFTNANGWAWTMWFKSNAGGVTSTNNEAFMICGSDGWHSRTILWIDYASSTDRRMTFFTELNNSATIKIEWDADEFLDDDWHHLVMCYGGVSDYNTLEAAGGTDGTDSFKFYIDGAYKSQLTATLGGASAPDPSNAAHDGLNQSLGITLMNAQNTNGSSASPTAGSVNCFIDEFTFWNKTLSSSEITDIYNSGNLVDISNLSFFSAANCGVWLKCGEATNDAVDDTTNSGIGNLYSAGNNSIQDSSGNDNHWFLNCASADAVSATGISTSDFAPSD